MGQFLMIIKPPNGSVFGDIQQCERRYPLLGLVRHDTERSRYEKTEDAGMCFMTGDFLSQSPHPIMGNVPPHIKGLRELQPYSRSRIADKLEREF